MVSKNNFYIVLKQEIELDGHIVIETEVFDELYTTKANARREIVRDSGGLQCGLVWSDNRMYAEVPCGTKYYDSYQIIQVNSKVKLQYEL